MPSSDPAIKAVIFDLDGVLADTIELHYQSWQMVADEMGIPLDRARYENILGRNREDSLDYLLATVGRVLSTPERQEALGRKNRYYLNLLANLNHSSLLPGVGQLLQDLQEQQILLAIGSSSKNAEVVLAKLGIRHCFQQVAAGDIVPNPKPAPDVFLKAAEMLQVDPSDCLVVEDAPAGVAAGLAAGMTVLGVGSASRLHQAHLVVQSLAELPWPALVQQLAS